MGAYELVEERRGGKEGRTEPGLGQARRSAGAWWRKQEEGGRRGNQHLPS
jgi:hypothetical protein